MSSSQNTQYHNAVGTLPNTDTLSQFPVPTPSCGKGQVLVKNEMLGLAAMSTWMMDFRYFSPKEKIVVFPGNVGGTIVARGEGVRDELQEGTKVVVGNVVFDVAHAASQELVLAEQECCMKVPEGFNLEQCTTLGSSVVAAFHALNNELGLPIPTEPGASKSSAHEANEVLNSPVLVWGGSTATGFYAVQMLREAGFKTIITTSSPGSHSKLSKLGATHTLSYSDPATTVDIVKSLLSDAPVKYVLDCAADLDNSLKPIREVVGEGSEVAVLVPVRKGGKGGEKMLVDDDKVEQEVEFGYGVEVKLVKSFEYMSRDPEIAKELQPTIIPGCLKSGHLQPSSFRLVEGESFLERMIQGLAELREGKVRGEKLLVRSESDVATTPSDRPADGRTSSLGWSLGLLCPALFSLFS